jgi:hypothetical protein
MVPDYLPLCSSWPLRQRHQGARQEEERAEGKKESAAAVENLEGVLQGKTISSTTQMRVHKKASTPHPGPPLCTRWFKVLLAASPPGRG